jgi:hypothetical protein
MKTHEKNEEKMEQLRSNGREKEGEKETIPVVEERERKHAGELVGESEEG